MTTPREDVHDEFVTVFESRDQALLAVAESLLEEADIGFLAKGRDLLELLGVGLVQLQVPADDAEEATAMLRDLEP